MHVSLVYAQASSESCGIGKYVVCKLACRRKPPGHQDTRNTMVHAHVLNRRGRVRSQPGRHAGATACCLRLTATHTEGHAASQDVMGNAEIS